MKRRLPLLAALLLAGCAAAPGPEPASGTPAPDFEVESLKKPGTKTSLKSLRGKVVVLDFWATWCGPCHMIAPIVERVHRDYEAKGLTTMAISDEGRKIVEEFEVERPHEVPVYLDPFNLAKEALVVQSLPTVVVVDRKGNVAYRSTGYGPTSEQELRDAVRKAIG